MQFIPLWDLRLKRMAHSTDINDKITISFKTLCSGRFFAKIKFYTFVKYHKYVKAHSFIKLNYYYDNKED